MSLLFRPAYTRFQGVTTSFAIAGAATFFSHLVSKYFEHKTHTFKMLSFFASGATAAYLQNKVSGLVPFADLFENKTVRNCTFLFSCLTFGALSTSPSFVDLLKKHSQQLVQTVAFLSLGCLSGKAAHYFSQKSEVLADAEENMVDVDETLTSRTRLSKVILVLTTLGVWQHKTITSQPVLSSIAGFVVFMLTHHFISDNRTNAGIAEVRNLIQAHVDPDAPPPPPPPLDPAAAAQVRQVRFDASPPPSRSSSSSHLDGLPPRDYSQLKTLTYNIYHQGSLYSLGSVIRQQDRAPFHLEVLIHDPAFPFKTFFERLQKCEQQNIARLTLVNKTRNPITLSNEMINCLSALCQEKNRSGAYILPLCELELEGIELDLNFLQQSAIGNNTLINYVQYVGCTDSEDPQHGLIHRTMTRRPHISGSASSSSSISSSFESLRDDPLLVESSNETTLAIESTQELESFLKHIYPGEHILTLQLRKPNISLKEIFSLLQNRNICHLVIKNPTFTTMEFSEEDINALYSCYQVGPSSCLSSFSLEGNFTVTDPTHLKQVLLQQLSPPVTHLSYPIPQSPSEERRIRLVIHFQSSPSNASSKT